MNDMNKPDTTLDEIRSLQPIPLDGLYYMHCRAIFDEFGDPVRYTEEPERITPRRVWFGCDLHEFQPDANGGEAFAHIPEGLWPVFKADGTRLVLPDLRNVAADYDGHRLYNFRRE